MTLLGDLTGRIDSFPYGFTTRRIDTTDSRLYWLGGLWLAAQVRLSSRQYQSINQLLIKFIYNENIFQK